MKIERIRRWSEELGRETEMRIYGHFGKPLILFPCQGGRSAEAEDFGMIGAITEFIERGQIKVVTIDSVDDSAWACTDERVGVKERAEMAERFDAHIVNEVVPLMRERCGRTVQKFGACGCSFGAYHAVNALVRHPEIFDACVSLSGVQQLIDFVGERFMGSGGDDDDGGGDGWKEVAAIVRAHSPMHFVRDCAEKGREKLELIRKSHIIICSGQGAWEHTMLRDMAMTEAVFRDLEIPAWFDRWGFDVNHDWPWWKKQLPYFLGILCNIW